MTQPTPEDLAAADASRRVKVATVRYREALHAMQTGVRTEIESHISDAHSPKHLRVGVNSTLVELGVLRAFITDRLGITEVEYVEALADAMEAEVRTYERTLSEHFGTKVTLA